MEEPAGASAEAISVPQQCTEASPEAAVCRHWQRTGGQCMYQEACQFRHPAFMFQPAPAERPVAYDAVTGKKKRVRPRNKGRAGEFRRWLLGEFGLDTLAGGSGVLDVAGGRGELSFELLNLNSCPSTIVDPREQIDYSRFQRKLLQGYYHRNDCLQEFNTAPDGFHPQSLDEIRTPGHLKLFWEPSFWEGLRLGLDAEGRPQSNPDNYDSAYRDLRAVPREPVDPEQHLSDCFSHARSFAWTEKGLKSSHSDSPTDDEVFDGWTLAQVMPLLTDCSCIVGMHPDQAAEGIVDFALQIGKPFAIVPCCVYSKSYPRKKRPDGKPVTSYQDLVDHLVAKHPNIQQATLPFEGKNQVVYWRPSP